MNGGTSATRTSCEVVDQLGDLLGLPLVFTLVVVDRVLSTREKLPDGPPLSVDLPRLTSVNRHRARPFLSRRGRAQSELGKSETIMPRWYDRGSLSGLDRLALSSGPDAGTVRSLAGPPPIRWYRVPSSLVEDGNALTYGHRLSLRIMCLAAGANWVSVSTPRQRRRKYRPVQDRRPPALCRTVRQRWPQPIDGSSITSITICPLRVLPPAF